ncbi:MAG TPA: hypothetical protein VEB67_01325 [Nitrososphaerales archaeon]|nr:hypothetical protein [Nitrososphaerales archaeon]
MLSFAESFAVWTLATAVPAVVGISLVFFVGKGAGPRLAAAFALGIFFWFFVDTIEGSSDLFVNFGFTGGVDQVAVVLLFAFGVLALFFVDDLLGQGLFSGTQAAGTLPIVPILAALAVGIHGLGEGAAFGSTASLTSSTSILDAFGGVTAGVAYALHKMLEPMMVGAIYVAYSKARPDLPTGTTIRDLLVMTILFVTPSLLGAVTGYFINYDSTYFFGLGTGTSIYVALRLGRQSLAPLPSSTGHEALKFALALVLGFMLIYIAALFHS